MGKRISYSLLDPILTRPIKGIYAWMRIPRWYPPEGIIAIGHMLAIAAAVSLAFAAEKWWGGIVLSLGVAGNHLADCLDGTHARATGQCRNGGELLDHFVDPLSFAYWLCGMAFVTHRLDWGLVGVICLYATAVLTNIKAKMLGEFTLARFGPTEFKSLLVVLGCCLTSLHLLGMAPQVVPVCRWFFAILLLVGLLQLGWNLVVAVVEVNRDGKPPDMTQWETRS